MFTFSLEALLEHRTRREEERQVELAGAKRSLAEEEKELKSVLRREAATAAELARTAGQARPAPMMAVLISLGEQLGKERRKQEAKLHQAKLHVEECRERLAQARKEKKMLEKLKDKQKELYVQEEARREAKHIEEAGRAAARAGRDM
ncbi:MAG: hypothetical protein AVO39_07915 [delta proteobacterium MLS_D]|nr:MAG: hypothetical protein AVO39_07915 [delta proteobacterium MLS_D]